jgi:hypothetical protein
MSTRVSLIFPYIGDEDPIRDRLIEIIDAILDRRKNLHTSNRPPILVVNKDTINRKIYEKFKSYLRDKKRTDLLEKIDLKEIDLIEVWAVDTCQMWLGGFGKIIDDKEDKSREDDTSCILQIPGDLKYIEDFDYFLQQLSSLGAMVELKRCDFAIGDFKIKPPQGAKHLIDMYGTYSLLFNWFPEIATYLRGKLNIERPRSEFFGVSLNFLEEMLRKRKFAYEQTLVFLIHALDDRKNWKIGKVDIGEISDYARSRGFREANDQIERTERMLKFLWREKNGGDNFNVEKFERLDGRSTAIRVAAIVSLENFLKP